MLTIIKSKLINVTLAKRAFYHKLRIGCASGFWGDTSVAIPQLIHQGKLNFLVFDYLSEITMSLLAKARLADSTKGYTPEFLNIARYAGALKNQGIRIIANAGGINLDGCHDELKKALDKAGVDMNIAIVKGDDLMTNKEVLTHLRSPDKVDSSNFLSSNVYFGAAPIRFALDKGADIVITGRCVDSALVLGPLMHHFRWDDSDIDKLASGSLAGHLIECGAQVTGGIFTDWHTVPDLWNIGFPIVEVDENGVFVVTKPDNTGGIVSPATVSEQLVYEIDDPASYVLPDVICDFTSVTLTEIGRDRVEVRGAKGYHPTPDFKVSSTYLDKYRLTAASVIIGKDAVTKGRFTAEQILKRVRHIMKTLNIPDFTRCNISIVGDESSYGSSKNKHIFENVREALVWISVEHSDKVPLKILSSEIAPAGTGMCPGLCSLIGGRPKVTPILKLHSSLLDKEKVQINVKVNSEEFILPSKFIKNLTRSHTIKSAESKNIRNTSSNIPFTIRDLAYTRSGDKGDICNIGVISRNDDAWEILKERLTIDVVGSYFSHVFPNDDWHGNVERFELQGIKALNFVLKNSLNGGGVSSLRFDPQGKAFGQILLDLKI